jgi:hypothetical protein
MHFTLGTDSNAHCHIFFHYTGAPPTTTQLQALASAWNTGWSTNMASQHLAYVIYTGCTWSDLSTNLTAPAVGTASIPGTALTGTNVADTCLLMNLNIARRYKGGHPRVYWPMLGNNDLQNSQAWKGTSLTAFSTKLAAQLNTVLSVSGLAPTLDQLCNVSYRTAHALRPTPLVDIAPTWSFNVIPATQRRRMGRP